MDQASSPKACRQISEDHQSPESHGSDLADSVAQAELLAEATISAAQSF
jgi:hypothetical protein